MQSIVLGHGFSTDFPIEVRREAEEIGAQKQLLFEAASKGRKDLRGEVTFTIDPADAKDLDDSISVKKLREGDIEIGVHIADVSAYVQEGSAIDKEAERRGTSVYLVDRTIPMLPPVLSNDLCSLNPNEDKLTFSAIFTLSKDGNVKRRWFGETIINSDRRFTYALAQETLKAGKGLFFEELSLANGLAKTLRGKRLLEGGLAFDQDEIGFKLDDRGRPVDVFVKERLDTNLLIEDFMLLANREVAEYVYRLCRKVTGRDAVFMYRIHDEPYREKIDQLAIFLKAVGYELNVQNGIVSSKSLNELFEKIQGTPEEHMIKIATIRSMAKAVYSTKNVGHFGLAFRYYTHFTSPIRRYPDLLVHRILKRHLDLPATDSPWQAGGSPVPQKEYAKYEQLAIHASEREVAAIEAERASVRYKQVEYMREHVGEAFEGIITGVTERGMFVEESKTKAEGLVRISTLTDDYYEVDTSNYRLIGKRTKKKYSLGDRVRVRLAAANLEEKTIDWTLVYTL
jgi:ribonuclease R